MECYKEHVHMFLNCLPILSPADIMQKIKVVSSRTLREEFVKLNKMPGPWTRPNLWTRSCFVSTAGNVSSKTVKIYVDEQKTRYYIRR